MTRKLVSSGTPSEQRAAYSRAVVQGDWCCVAGTTAYDPATGHMPENVADQARIALEIVENVLIAEGFVLSDVVRATFYVIDHAYWEAIIPVLGEIFAEARPAATCLIAGLVKPEMKIEIEVTALRRPA